MYFVVYFGVGIAGVKGRPFAVYSVYLLYWYKSTNADAARLQASRAGHSQCTRCPV